MTQTTSLQQTKSRYFRISVTDVCNLGCYFCHNEGQSKRVSGGRDVLSADDVIFAASAAYTHGFRKIKITGGEPTLRCDIVEIIAGIRALGVEDLSMITNGIRLSGMAAAFKEAGLPRLNVSLYTLNAEKFQSENNGSVNKLAAVVEGIDHAIALGYSSMKLNYVYHGHRDDAELEQICAFAGERSLTLVVLPILPINLQDSDESQTLREVYETLSRMGIAAETVITDAEGIIKKKLVMENGASVILREQELGGRLPYKHCTQCAKRTECREGIFPVRLTAAGILRPCLADVAGEFDIVDALKRRDVDAVNAKFADIDHMMN